MAMNLLHAKTEMRKPPRPVPVGLYLLEAVVIFAATAVLVSLS